MLALRPDIVEAVWQAVAGHLPETRGEGSSARLSPRARPDRDCFEAILFPPRHRVQLGRRRPPRQGGETTLRRRRDEWLEAGSSTPSSPRRFMPTTGVIGLDLSEVAIDGSLHKAPCGGEGRDRALSIGERPAGSGRSPRIASASRSAGQQTGRTATTRSFCRRHLETSPPEVLSKRSRRFTSTAAMTTTSCAPTSPASASTISSAREREHQVSSGQEEEPAARIALAGRADELMAVELRRASGATPTASSPSDSLS